MKEIENSYEKHLSLESLEHSDVLFMQHARGFSIDLCPQGGIITYLESNVLCDIYSKHDEEVPFYKKLLNCKLVEI